MKNQHVIANKQRLDSLFDYINDLRKLNNFQLESQWAIYLCIRVSGFLETSLRTIFVSYCNDKAHPYIVRYVGNSMDSSRSQNMKPENILNLASSFSIDWRNELESYIAEDGRKEAIESVINIRNSAAHGGTISVTYTNIKNYYNKICDVIDFISNQCDAKN